MVTKKEETMNKHAETLINYAIQIEHDIALDTFAGHRDTTPLPEVPANLRKAAAKIVELEARIDILRLEVEDAWDSTTVN